jgi:hypothetical protein
MKREYILVGVIAFIAGMLNALFGSQQFTLLVTTIVLFVVAKILKLY